MSVLLDGLGGCSPLFVCTATGLKALSLSLCPWALPRFRMSSTGCWSALRPCCCSRCCCCCCNFFACVGITCWSGGKRGSGLYIVANHGASPSGRLIAVAGRGSRPERDFGLVADAAAGEPRAEFVEAERGFGWACGCGCSEAAMLMLLRSAAEALRAEAAAAVGRSLLLAERIFEGDVEGVPCWLAVESGMGVGVPFRGSVSSSRIWLPALWLLRRFLG